MTFDFIHEGLVERHAQSLFRQVQSLNLIKVRNHRNSKAHQNLGEHRLCDVYISELNLAVQNIFVPPVG
jgi:hypothetical protein